MRIPSPLRQAFALVAPCLLAVGIWFGQRPSTAQPSPAVTFANLSTNSFRVTNAIVTVRGVGVQQGTNVFITNLFVTNLVVNEININSNLFVTNITVTSNLFATNIYVTNLYATNIFVEEITVNSNLFVTNLFATNIFTTEITVNSNLFVTNIFVNEITVNSNLFVTNLFVTNLFATTENVTNLYVTNIFNTFLVTSNIVAGNINGTTNTLAMFTPDSFSVGDSIVTQPETNRIVVNGGGTGYITLGGTNLQEITWGTDLTNHLVRDTYTLNYNVDGDASAIFVRNSASKTSSVLVDEASTSGQFLTSEPTVIWGNSTANLQFSGSVINGNVRGHQLGSQFIGFGDMWSRGTFYLEGYQELINTNYSRLAISHSGTNGAIFFESQSSGIAGTPRNFIFTNNASPTSLQVANTNGSGKLQVTTGGNFMVLAGAGEALFLGAANNGSGDVALTATGFVPVSTATVGLGSSSGGWKYLVLAGMTKAQKTALTPTDGMVVYQTDNTPGLRAYVAGTWFMLPLVADP